MNEIPKEEVQVRENTEKEPSKSENIELVLHQAKTHELDKKRGRRAV